MTSSPKPMFLLRDAAILVCGIAILNALAMVFYWYWFFPWFDSVMHFSGGVWLGIVFLFIFFRVPALRFKFLFVLIGVAIVSVGWEVFEWVLDWYFQTSLQPNILDTAIDLACDMLGGAIGYAYGTFRISQKKFS